MSGPTRIGTASYALRYSTDLCVDGRCYHVVDGLAQVVDWTVGSGVVGLVVEAYVEKDEGSGV